LPSSPADRGRDIVGKLQQTDLDATIRLETWFASCKHYKRGVPPEKLQGTLAWAQAERPHVVLIVASGFLSNPAKDHLADYEVNNRPPFRIKYWERPILERLIEGRDKLLQKYLLHGMRRENEILAIEQELTDKVWFNRHQLRASREDVVRTIDPEIWKGALKAATGMRRQYGKKNLGPYDDFEWGMLNGKLSALRWVLGDEWDMLDT
jgi:hypothetical protein